MPLQTERIDGIVWDLDNTLYRFSDDFKERCNIAAAKTAQDLGIDLSYEDSFKLAQKSETEYGYSLHGYILHHGFTLEQLHVPFHANIDEHSITKIDGVAKGLQSLTQKQVILTNAARDWAQRILKYIGASHLFDDNHIIPIEEVGFEPKARGRKGFDKALEILNLKAEQILMVDDLDRNLIIPHEMGMQTVLISYEEPMTDQPHYIDAQFFDIIALLKHISVERRNPDPVF